MTFKRTFSQAALGDATRSKGANVEWTEEEDAILHKADRCVEGGGSISQVTKKFGLERSPNAQYKRRNSLPEKYTEFRGAGLVTLLVSVGESIPAERRGDGDQWRGAAEKLNTSVPEVISLYKECLFWHILESQHGVPISESNFTIFKRLCKTPLNGRKRLLRLEEVPEERPAGFAQAPSISSNLVDIEGVLPISCDGQPSEDGPLLYQVVGHRLESCADFCSLYHFPDLEDEYIDLDLYTEFKNQLNCEENEASTS